MPSPPTPSIPTTTTRIPHTVVENTRRLVIVPSARHQARKLRHDLRA